MFSLRRRRAMRRIAILARCDFLNDEETAKTEGVHIPSNPSIWKKWWYGLVFHRIGWWENWNRKTLSYLMVKSMVSCRFSLKPIHWNYWTWPFSSLIYLCFTWWFSSSLYVYQRVEFRIKHFPISDRWFCVIKFHLLDHFFHIIFISFYMHIYIYIYSYPYPYPYL